MNYDAVVIGGGPGGYVTAIRIAQLGGKVAVVERDELGGTCLNRGCIPTKSLIAAVERLAMIEDASSFGIEVNKPTINFTQVQARKDEVVSKLVNGIHYLFKKHKITLFSGVGKIKTANEVEVNADGETTTLNCKNIVIAAGSSPGL